MKLRLAYSLAILLLILDWTYGHSKEPDKNVIKEIIVNETTQHTTIRIKGSQIPTFNVFKLEEPYRLFVDIARGDIGGVDSMKYIGNGVVDQVGTLQFKSKGQLVGRVIIGMVQDSQYDVRTEGNEIIVTIEGTPRRMEGEMLLSEKEKIRAEKEQIKAELEKEKEILRELKSARKNEETLLQKIKESKEREDALRKELEQATANLKKMKERAEMEKTVKEQDLKKISDSIFQQKAEKEKLETLAKMEKEKLEILKKEKERAEKERAAIAEALKAEKEAVAAAKKAREAEEERQKSASLKRMKEEELTAADQKALQAEKEKLVAVQELNRIEEEKKNALLALKKEEEKKLELAKLSLEKEEKLLKELSELRLKEEKLSAALKMENEKIAMLNAELEKGVGKEKTEKERLEAERKKEELLKQQAEEARRIAVLQNQIEELKKTELEKARKQEEELLKALKEAAEKEKALAEAKEKEKKKEAELQAAMTAKKAKEKETEVAKQMLLAKETAMKELQQISKEKESAHKSLSKIVKSLEEEKTKLAELVKKIEMEEAALKKLAVEKEKSITLYENYKKKMEEEEARIGMLKEMIAREQGEYEKIVKNRKMEEERISTLKKELEGLISKRAIIETEEAKRLREELRKKEDELDGLKIAINEIKRQEKEKGTKNASSLKNLEAELKKRETAIATLKAEYEKALSSEKNLRKVLMAKEGEISALKERYDETEKKLYNISKENRQAESRIKELETQLDERDKTIEKLNMLYLASQAAKKEAESSRNAQILKESEKLQNELAKAKKEREELLKQLNEEKTASRDFTKEKAKLETELSALKTALTASEESLKQQQAKFSEQIAVYEKELKENRDKIKQLTALKEKERAAAQKTVALVKDIGFNESGELSKVLIKTAAAIPSFEVIQEGKSSAILSLKNTAIPKNLERKLDVSEFDSHVIAISSYSTEDKRNVNIFVDVKPGTENRVYVEGGNIVWEFSSPKGHAIASQKHVPLITGTTGKSKTVAHAGTALEQKGAKIELPSVKKETEEKGYLNPQDVLKSKKKKYKGKKINLTVKDADIQHVLTFLAKEGKVNIVTSEEVSGKVTFHLENIPWDLALDTILKAKGLDYVVEQGIYRIAPVERIQKEYELELEKKKKIEELKPVIVHLIRLNYASAKEIAPKVGEVLSPNGVTEVDERTNTLIVKDTEDYIAVAEELIKRLDTQTPQVLIEARIVEARTSFKEEIGIQWGGHFAMASVYGNETGLVFPSNIGIAGGAADPATPLMGLRTTNPNFAVNLPAAVGTGAGGAIGIQLGSVGGAANLNLRLSAAEEEGEVKIISSPKITTLDNRKAVIQQGVSIPISVVSAAGVNTQFFSADLKLEVTPHVTRDGNVSMKIDITKNEPDFGNLAADGNPTIQKKEAHTELLIKDGDTTVIGGIYTRNTGRSVSKVPLLSSIPILGWFFKSISEKEDRSEMLIFITPKVVNREPLEVSSKL